MLTVKTYIDSCYDKWNVASNSMFIDDSGSIFLSEYTTKYYSELSHVQEKIAKSKNSYKILTFSKNLNIVDVEYNDRTVYYRYSEKLNDIPPMPKLSLDYRNSNTIYLETTKVKLVHVEVISKTKLDELIKFYGLDLFKLIFIK